MEELKAMLEEIRRELEFVKIRLDAVEQEAEWVPRAIATLNRRDKV